MQQLQFNYCAFQKWVSPKYNKKGNHTSKSFIRENSTCGFPLFVQLPLFCATFIFFNRFVLTIPFGSVEFQHHQSFQTQHELHNLTHGITSNGQIKFAREILRCTFALYNDFPKTYGNFQICSYTFALRVIENNQNIIYDL